MKITDTCLKYVTETGISPDRFVVGDIRFENKKITGTVINLRPVVGITQDDRGWLVECGDPDGKNKRIFRDGTESEIFLNDVPDDFFTFRPFDDSNRDLKADVGELDRIKRILATGLALRHFGSLTGWAIEGISVVEHEGAQNTEAMVIFQNEGDALLIGSIFHEALSDTNTDFTSITATKEPTVPWLSQEDTATLNGENEKRA